MSDTQDQTVDQNQQAAPAEAQPSLLGSTLNFIADTTLDIAPYTMMATPITAMGFWQTDPGKVMQQQIITNVSEAPGFLGGAVGDLGHGFGTTVYNLWNFGEWTNPLYRFGRSNSYTERGAEWTRETIGDPIINVSTSSGVAFKSTSEFAQEYLNSMVPGPNGTQVSFIQSWATGILNNIRYNDQGQPIFRSGDLGNTERTLYNAYTRFDERTKDSQGRPLPGSNPAVASETDLFYETARGAWMSTEYDSWKQNWQRRMGIEGDGVMDYNYTTDGGRTWHAVDGSISTAVVLGNIVDPTLLAGGVGIIGKARLVRVGAEALEVAGKASFVVGGVAISASLVNQFSAEAPKVSQLSELLLERGNSFATENGVFRLQWQLNKNNQNLIDTAVGSDAQHIPANGNYPARTIGYIDADGTFDDATKYAFLDAASMVRYSELYRAAGEEGDVDSRRAYESVMQIQDRFYELAEQYVNDPEHFNPTQNDMLVMQFYMYGNGFTGFAQSGVQLGLAGKDYTLGYLDQYFRDVPAARAALMTSGPRRDYSAAAAGQDAEFQGGSTPGTGFIMDREQRADQADVRADNSAAITAADEAEREQWLERQQRMAMVPML
ncbi:MAG: hypothetical protein AB7E85_00685 [Pseudobdellovibrionaceae bacterium]